MRTLLLLGTFLVAFLGLYLASTAFGAPPPDMGAVAVAPDPGTDLGGFVDAVIQAVKLGHLRILIALVLIGVIWVFRRYVGRLVPWFQTDRGGAVSAILLGIGGAFVTRLLGTAPVSAGFVLDGVVLGLTAAGGWSVFRRILFPQDLAPTPVPPANTDLLGPMATLVCASAVFMTSASGCAVGKQVGTDVAACALNQLPAAIASIIPEVEKAMRGSATEWSAEITALEGQGVDFAVCAVAAAWTDISKSLTTMGQAADPARSLALDRGAVYLARHHATPAAHAAR